MAELGLLTIVNDVEINPDLIANWIKDKKSLYNIQKIAVDSYRYTVLSKSLKSIGYDANEKAVKLVRPSDVMLVQPKINSVFLNGLLTVGDDPMFRWAVNNTKLEPAPNDNFRYAKIEPKSRKNDMFMAYVAAMTLEEELPDYNDLLFLDPIIF
jgi:phage terminase large subunit-like protein